MTKVEEPTAAKLCFRECLMTTKKIFGSKLVKYSRRRVRWCCCCCCCCCCCWCPTGWPDWVTYGRLFAMCIILITSQKYSCFFSKGKLLSNYFEKIVKLQLGTNFRHSLGHPDAHLKSCPSLTKLLIYQKGLLNCINWIYIQAMLYFSLVFRYGICMTVWRFLINKSNLFLFSFRPSRCAAAR
jgi:hypothetical protein